MSETRTMRRLSSDESARMLADFRGPPDVGVLIEQLRAAITDKGNAPGYHDSIERHHREEWPTLWEAIDQLIAFDEQHRFSR